MRRGGGSGNWKSVKGREYREEAELQQLLYDSPDLIPIEDLGEQAFNARLFIKEAGLPGSGNTDLIGVDEHGGISIVECKLASNSDIRRKVIGQVLEYASFLWETTYQGFDRIVERCEGKSLANLMEERLIQARSADDWDAEVFREAIENTLQTGSFRLVVAVDEVTSELRRIVEYVNATGPAAFSIHALEMHYFEREGTELLVPQMLGVAPKRPPTPPTGRKKWDRGRFFEAVEESVAGEVVEVVRWLYELAEKEADDIFWGTGKTYGSFTFHLHHDGLTLSVYTVTTEGKIVCNFGYLKDRIPGDLLT